MKFCCFCSFRTGVLVFFFCRKWYFGIYLCNYRVYRKSLWYVKKINCVWYVVWDALLNWGPIKEVPYWAPLPKTDLLSPLRNPCAYFLPDVNIGHGDILEAVSRKGRNYYIRYFFIKLGNPCGFSMPWADS